MSADIIDADTDLDLGLASNSDEVEILKQLAVAIESGVQDIRVALGVAIGRLGSPRLNC
jgi:hypothetical protein